MNGKDLVAILVALFLGVTFFVKFSWCLIGCIVLTVIFCLSENSGTSSNRGNFSNRDSSDNLPGRDDETRSNSDDDRIYDSRGNMINGKLREYERRTRETGIADTEYEQELKDGYSYCDDHDDYDDCYYGHDD